MSSGPRPGRPIMGQRPMFGGGSPVFARMPSYTPVTRSADHGLPPQSEPSQSGAYPQGAQGYPGANSAPAQSYPSGNPAPARPYPGPQQSAPQAYPNGNGYPAQGYSGHGNPTHGYAGQGYPDQGYADRGQAGQGQPAQSYPSQGYQPESDASLNAGFADQNFGNANFPNASMPAAGYPAAGYAPASGADASFPENGFTEDASFPEDAGYSGNGAYQHDEPLNLEMPNGAYGQQAYQPGNEQARHETMASQGGQYSQPDPHRAVQPFDAIYDQPPQIALGGTQARRSPQSFYDGEQSDADFLDDAQAPVADAAVATRKLSIKGRSMFMVGSALLGAVALGGALAFAYKQGGGAMNGGEPPLVQADNRPVKEAPDQPAGKDLPHKNKLIYDRLESEDKPETDHLVPRQEDVAVPAMPASVDTAGLSAAQTPGAPQITEAVDTGTVPPGTVATVDDPEGGPRHVKTMVVRPDGSVVPPAVPDAAAAPAPAQVASAEAPMAAPAAQAPAKPKPVKAAVAPAAAEDPAPKAAAPKSPSQFVVQVASKQNQTEALATFADMQQKYPSLLASYRPIVQKADLGTKGVWYRLRIGPINDKTVASKLCTQLKSQGLNDCLVMTE
jgi:cell division septation protein DedD